MLFQSLDPIRPLQTKLAYRAEHTVQATDGSQFSDWSETWSFTTVEETLETPILVSPENGAVDQLTSLTLDWNTGGSAQPIDLDMLIFSGGSGNCITDLWVSNIHSCSPLNINPLDEGNVYYGSTHALWYNGAKPTMDGYLLPNPCNTRSIHPWSINT